MLPLGTFAEGNLSHGSYWYISDLQALEATATRHGPHNYQPATYSSGFSCLGACIEVSTIMSFGQILQYIHGVDNLSAPVRIAPNYDYLWMV